LHVLFFNYKVCVCTESQQGHRKLMRAECVYVARAAPDCLKKKSERAHIKTLRRLKEQRNLHFLALKLWECQITL
jgi:hypothetical protein